MNPLTALIPCRPMSRLLMQISRVALACIFLSSSMPKIQHPYLFLSAVYQYELLGPKTGVLMAMLLPWFEFILGVALIGGVFLNGAFLCSSMLGLVFAFAHTTVLYRGLGISCGCFSTSETQTISYGTLLRSLGFLMASLIGWVTLYRSTVTRSREQAFQPHG